MTIYDRFRALKVNLFDKFEVPNATVTHTEAGVRTDTDRAKGRVPSPVTTTFPLRAVLTLKTRKADNGTLYTHASATLDGAVSVDDRIQIGAVTYTVVNVNEINPDGTAAILHRVDLK